MFYVIIFDITIHDTIGLKLSTSILKKLSQRTNNFIAKTLATQHQLFSIYCNQTTFSPVEVGAGMLAHV